MLTRLKAWAKRLKANLILLWLCCRDDAMPWPPKVIGLITLAYAASPIDLIPDFIPVLGYLDDVLLVPLGIALALRLTPTELVERCRPIAAQKAGQNVQIKGRWMALGLITIVWVALLYWLYRRVVPGFS
jgi:uncharacterized membrane protein YkvA (DUF1232 family)